MIYGEIGVRDDDGDTIECHICGKRFRDLGNHVRRTHGISSRDYRREFGLRQRDGLISASLREVRRLHADHLREYRESASEALLTWRRENQPPRDIALESRLDKSWLDAKAKGNRANTAAHLSRRQSRICVRCGTEFESTPGGKKRYCSKACYLIRTHCKRGHEFTLENTGYTKRATVNGSPERYCRACRRIYRSKGQTCR